MERSNAYLRNLVEICNNFLRNRILESEVAKFITLVIHGDPPMSVFVQVYACTTKNVFIHTLIDILNVALKSLILVNEHSSEASH